MTTHLSLPVLALFLMPSSALAQGWQVDPTLVTLQMDAEAFADHDCNNVPAFVPVPKIAPFPYDVIPIQLPLVHPGSVFKSDSQDTLGFPFYPFGLRFDFGAMVAPTARDACSSPVEAVSTASATLLGDGLGTRTLWIFSTTRVNNRALDGDFFDRGYASMALTLKASLQNLPQTTRPLFLRSDWGVGGSADSSHECPGDVTCQGFGTPDEEDPGAAKLEFKIEIGQNGPLVLADSTLDPGAGFAAWLIDKDSFSTLLAVGTNSIDVDVDITTFAAHTLMAPITETSTANFDASLTLHLISHNFVTLEPFRSYMRCVGRSGAGPGYSFCMGRYEITNQQYADFLNAAELDGGTSGLGSFLVFDSDGRMLLPDGTLAFEPSGFGSGSRIVYTASAPLGTRYTVELPQGKDPRSFERHPVTNVSWYGAVKFCNWLTLERGLSPSARCYTEGATADDWHPVTISTADWVLRDLNDAERVSLLGYIGFRLPMDDSGVATGWLSDQPSSFNEWYKAAAYDPLAPPTTRTGPGGEAIPPLHWAFGFGRDVLGLRDANFFASADPFDNDDAFVGLYDGTHYNPISDDGVGSGASFSSVASANRYGFYDLAGNVAEWMQDRANGSAHAVRGGSFGALAAESAAAFRASRPPAVAKGDVGFRVVWRPRKFFPRGGPVQHP